MGCFSVRRGPSPAIQAVFEQGRTNTCCSAFCCCWSGGPGGARDLAGASGWNCWPLHLLIASGCCGSLVRHFESGRLALINLGQSKSAAEAAPASPKDHPTGAAGDPSHAVITAVDGAANSRITTALRNCVLFCVGWLLQITAACGLCHSGRRSWIPGKNVCRMESGEQCGGLSTGSCKQDSDDPADSFGTS